MSGVIEQWLGASKNTVAHLESEVSEHQVAIQEAMAAIRAHTEYIHHLQHHLEIIRRATGDVDEGLGVSELEQSISEAFRIEYDVLESAAIETSDGIPIEAEEVDSNAHSAPVLPLQRRTPESETNATGRPRCTPSLTPSPGMAISASPRTSVAPVTSVVRKKNCGV